MKNFQENRDHAIIIYITYTTVCAPVIINYQELLLLERELESIFLKIIIHIFTFQCWQCEKRVKSCVAGMIKAVIFNLFAGAEPQRNFPMARGTPVQYNLIVLCKKTKFNLSNKIK